MTESEMIGILNSMNSKTTKGSDYLPSKLIKLAALSIVPPQTKLINRCFEIGFFPESIKVAEVVPIYMTWDIINYENYRPISSLPVISKIIERAINNRMMSYIYSSVSAKTIDAWACNGANQRIFWLYNGVLLCFPWSEKSVPHYQSWLPSEQTQWLWLRRSDIDHSQILYRL